MLAKEGCYFSQDEYEFIANQQREFCISRVEAIKRPSEARFLRLQQGKNAKFEVLIGLKTNEVLAK